MRLLITGITGFVGSHMAEYALTQGAEVFGSSRWRSRTENIEHLRQRIKLIECDLRDLAAVRSLLEATEPAKLLPRAKELAAQIAAKPPLAVRYAKRTLRLAQSQSLEEHLQSCASFQAALQKTEDHLEALSAFFEKRAGSFKGR